ncbi:MAG TPA: class I SAM-dependent methyltransferase [Allosphingosinicella sp.]
MTLPQPQTPERFLKSSRRSDEAGRPADALAEAWRAFDLAPCDRLVKAALADLLNRHPNLAGEERREDIARLAEDGDINPATVAPAAWRLLLARDQPLRTLAGDPEALAQWLETDGFAVRMLRETWVPAVDAEKILTRLRRWLLLSRRWHGFPRLAEALARQAEHNGGAWPFDDDERAGIDSHPDFAAAFRPRRPELHSGAVFADPVTRAVADQYRGWPYPPWSRLARPAATTLPAMVEKLDGGRPSGLPVEAEILVAGCGSGHDPGMMALTFPDSRVTAIDISETSLAEAEERTRAAGLSGIDYRLLDLHLVAETGRAFDFIRCRGVLHHLPDPEAGWAALVDVLRPGGVMQIMVYSRISRLQVRAARSVVADLLDRPVDDDLLREVRRRLMDKAPQLLPLLGDFSTLAGVHDLLLHRHEDPFDVARIVRALDRLGLELLAFDLPSPPDRAGYRREHPDDPGFRDVEAWKTLERTQPRLFAKMLKFWCRKPAS